jgi:hypothetical protein
MVELIVNAVLFLLFAIPVLRVCRNYPLYVHRAALWKAFFLWAVSTSPVIASVLLSSPASSASSVGQQFQDDILKSFSISEMFVYTAAFISPMLYVLFDVIRLIKDEEIPAKRKNIEDELRGMEAVFLTAIFLIIITLLAYASFKSDPIRFNSTYLSRFLTGKGYLVYFSSLLVWYSVILWESMPRDKFVGKQKRRADNFASDYAERRGDGA